MRRFQPFLFLPVMLVLIPSAKAQEIEKPLPKVVEHKDPIYPPLARYARITGEVRLKITTDGKAVTIIEAEAGHPVLLQAAEENIRTWRFEPHDPGTFTVTFRYSFQSEDGDVVFLPPRSIVDIKAPAPPVRVVY